MRKRLPFLITCVVLLAALCAVATYGFSQLLLLRAESEVLDSVGQAVEQTAINLEDRMNSVTALSQMITSDSRLQKSVWRNASKETMENQLKDIKELRELVSIAMGRGDISLVRLYISSDKMLSRERVNFYPVSEIYALPEYNAEQWMSYWYQSHFIDTLGFSGEVLSFCRAVRGKGSQLFDQICAFLIIDIDAAQLRDIISFLELPGNADENRVFITDGAGSIMLDDGGQPIAPQLARTIALKADSAGFLQSGSVYDGEEIAYLRRPLGSSGWVLAAAIPRDHLLSDSSMLQMAMFATIVALVLVTALCAGGIAFVVYTRGVRHQISTINQSLARTGRAPVSKSPEKDLFLINQSIGELLQTAARATEEAYDARLRERDAVLRALQAQINPHFLYNTLDTINWMAIEADAPNVSHMIETLAYYYRISLSKGKDIVCFSEELNIVKAYLEIQSVRFDHEFEVRLEVADDTLSCIIPKLTMQPLVENALLHGLRKRRDMRGALLQITARLEEGWLVVHVRDNGSGLSQNGTSSGYGLTNVRQRLELFTSGQYELTIRDLPEGGVEASIRLRARYSEG